MTTKEILTENRDSIISSLKYVFKIWKSEDVKIKMYEFLDYAEKNTETIIYAANAKNTKTLLKIAVQKMAISQKPIAKKFNLREAHGAYMESNNYSSFNHLTKSYNNFN